MAGVAQRDVDTISNQSGDTFLLSDVDTDFPSVEQPAVLPSSLPVSTVSENSNGAVSNVSYAAITAASTPAAAPRVQENLQDFGIPLNRRPVESVVQKVI